MPPHCDTVDGPVVVAARKALEAKDVKLVLPFAPKRAEEDIRKAFERTLNVRDLGKDAKDLADLWFFETVVRLHREGEGAPYTGLKPAGLDWGPVVPLAEKAIGNKDPKEVIAFMTRTLEKELSKRFELAMALRDYDKTDVDAARRYVSASLGFQLYSHHLHTAIVGGEERGEKAAGHGHNHQVSRSPV